MDDSGEGTAELTLALSSSVNPGRLQGTLPDWTFGSLPIKYTSPGSSVPPRTLGNVTTQGGVDVPLPTLTSAELVPFLQNCKTEGTFTVPSARIIAIGQEDLVVRSTAGDPVGTIREVLADGTLPETDSIVRVYSDSVGTFNGTVACQYSESYVVGITLKQGWNVVRVSTAGAPFSVRSLPESTRTTLTFTRFKPQVNVSIQNAPDTLVAGSSVELDVNLQQVGGISGEVTIETHVPGVAVAPGSLTLPSLSGASGPQGVRDGAPTVFASPVKLLTRTESVRGEMPVPQAMNPKLKLVVAEDAKEYSGPLNIVVKQGGVEVGRGTIYSIQVRVPTLNAYAGSLQIARAETQPLNVSISARYGFTGPVTLALKGLPEGLSALPVQVNLTADGEYRATLDVTASDAPVVGQTTAMLVASGRGQTFRSPVPVEVLRAGISAEFSQSYLPVYAKETTTLGLTLTSQNNFSGAVSVMLEGLPAGVTAPPVTVNLTPGERKSVTVPVTASADAAFATTTVRLAVPELLNSQSPQVQMQVMPARLALEGEVSGLTAAGSGIWLHKNLYTESAGNHIFIQPFSGGQKGGTFTFTGYGTPLPTPNGDVIMLGHTIKRIDASGNVTPLGPGLTGSYSSPAADIQGNIWYLGFDQGRYGLHVRDVQTGETSTLLSPSERSDFGDGLVINNAGTVGYVLGLGPDRTKVHRFDVATRRVTEVQLPVKVTFGPLAAADDGTLWGLSSDHTVFRLNADGSITTVAGLGMTNSLAFDRKGPNILWAASSSTLGRLNTTSLTVTSISNLSFLSLFGTGHDGGAWYVTKDSEQYYVNWAK